MRVITGEARGCRLETLQGDEVRPTTDKVKEAIFSAIQFDIPGRKFLDLFAGSGQMGIEALSRGAEEAYFIDASRKAIDITRKNLATAKLYSKGKVFHTDSFSFINSTDELFDIVFLDPPYEKGILQEILPIVAKKVKKTGIIIAESSEKEELLQNYDDFTLDRTRHYGKILVSIYRHKEFIF